jgi:hypothetical protein
VKRAQIATGVALAALYVVVASLSFRGGLLPIRPLFDGSGPPPPYRWVKPPPDLAQGNVLPTSAHGTMPITAKGSDAYNLNTDDGQASIIFPPNGVQPKAGETKVNVAMEPLDPATLGAPPAGRDYDGNAYRVTATYARSGAPITIPPTTCSLNGVNACATIVLRYAFSATELYRRDGNAWTKVPAQTASAALQIYGVTDKFGVFIAVDPHLPGGPKKGKSQLGNFIAFAAGIAAILIGTLAARARAKRRRKGRSTRAKRTKQRREKPSGRKADRKVERWWDE